MTRDGRGIVFIWVPGHVGIRGNLAEDSNYTIPKPDQTLTTSVHYKIPKPDQTLTTCVQYTIPKPDQTLTTSVHYAIPRPDQNGAHVLHGKRRLT